MVLISKYLIRYFIHYVDKMFLSIKQDILSYNIKEKIYFSLKRLAPALENFKLKP